MDAETDEDGFADESAYTASTDQPDDDQDKDSGHKV